MRTDAPIVCWLERIALSIASWLTGLQYEWVEDVTSGCATPVRVVGGTPYVPLTRYMDRQNEVRDLLVELQGERRERMTTTRELLEARKLLRKVEPYADAVEMLHDVRRAAMGLAPEARSLLFRDHEIDSLHPDGGGYECRHCRTAAGPQLNRIACLPHRQQAQTVEISVLGGVTQARVTGYRPG